MPLPMWGRDRMLPNPHILAIDIVLSLILQHPTGDPTEQECVVDRLLGLRVDEKIKELTEAR